MHKVQVSQRLTYLGIVFDSRTMTMSIDADVARCKLQELEDRYIPWMLNDLSDHLDYGHSHGVIGRTLMETAGEHVAILYNSADGRFVCVMLLATLSFPKRNAAHSDHFA